MDVLEKEYKHDEGVHNPDLCIACVVERIRKAESRGETPDMHDLVILRPHHGGYW